jgi:hypothetical protein
MFSKLYFLDYVINDGPTPVDTTPKALIVAMTVPSQNLTPTLFLFVRRVLVMV